MIRYRDRCSFSATRHILFGVFVVLSAAQVSLGQASSAGPTRRVLILNSYHRDFPWTDHQEAAAEKVLNGAMEVLELYAEYMDTKRVFNEPYLELLRQTFRMKYDGVELDAIIATDDNALNFLLRYNRELFGDPPVVFCGINDFTKERLQGRNNFTGLVEVLDVKATIDLALKLRPATRRVVVVVDDTPTGMGQRKDVAAVARQYDNLTFEYLKGEDLTNEELLAKLRELPDDSIVLLTVWLRDKTGAYLPASEGGKRISANSPVPVYGIIDMFLGHGIVGGKLLNSETHGSTAAEMVLRILDGTSPADIPVQIQSNNPYMFDYRQLDRWSIDRSELPRGSVIVYRPSSFYAEYKHWLWGVVAAFAVLIALVAVLSWNILRRRQAELQREKLVAELAAKNDELERFTYTVSHDLKSPLITVGGFLGLLEQDVAEGNAAKATECIARALGATEKMHQLLDGILELSRIGRVVNPPERIALAELVDEALELLGGRISERGVRIEISPNLPVVHGDHLRLRETFQNLIENAVKYMGDQPEPRIDIGVRHHDNETVCFVRDNGMGIDPKYHEHVFDLFRKLDAHSDGTGAGLALVKRIIETQGGRIWVESDGAGQGSTFCFTLPAAVVVADDPTAEVELAVHS